MLEHSKRHFLLALCLILLAIALIFAILRDWQLKPKIVRVPQIALEKSVNILLLGTDEVIPGKLKSWNGRSDFIALININPHTNRVSILSIPRDTYIELKKYDFHKINAANVFGGYQLSKQAVQKLLEVKIDHVVVCSIKAVIDLIDQFGPFKILVTEQMSYHDHSANLHIEIKPGLHVMNGPQLMNYLRYRKDKGDIGRIGRQQIFFRAVIRKLKEPSVIFKLPGVLFQANKLFLTDMEFKEMFKLGSLVKSLSPEQFNSYMVPGDFGSDGSWISDKIQLQALMQKICTDNIEKD